MDVEAADLSLAAVAGAIADPARSRCSAACWTATRVRPPNSRAVADIGASTASGHFLRLREQGLVEMLVQGRHRYYRLANAQVAQALEALLSLTDRRVTAFQPSTPSALKQARTCYDHTPGKSRSNCTTPCCKRAGSKSRARTMSSRKRAAPRCRDWNRYRRPLASAPAPGLSLHGLERALHHISAVRWARPFWSCCSNAAG